MYRTNDPRFRRRLNEIGQTLESANESAQSSLYIFGQNYVAPCLHSIGECFTSCIDASCPTLNLSQRDRLRRRGRGRSRGRAELSFDFYDDWDMEDEGDGLLGWGGVDEVAAPVGYGTVTAQQPGRKRGMSYPKGRRRSAVLPHDGGPDPTVIPGSSGFWGRLCGGKTNLRYKPSAAGLQEHPGKRKKTKTKTRARDLTEGEALLEEHGEEARGHRRTRSGTVASHDTSDSYSSRGDIFPSDEEDDAIPLDDEFAMVLERRTTLTGERSGPETETSSGKSGSRDRRRGKRPSAGSRTSTRRTFSSRSTLSGKERRSRAGSTAAPTPIDERETMGEEEIPSLVELKQEERRIEQEEEADVERRRLEAQRAALERGLSERDGAALLSSKEATPQNSSPVMAPVTAADEPSQLPTPLPTDDEEDDTSQQQTEQRQEPAANQDENKDTQP